MDYSSGIKYIIVAVVAVGVIAMAYHIGYSNGQKSERVLVQQAVLEQVEKVKAEDDRRLKEQERIVNETKKQLETAHADAKSARSNADKLREQLRTERNKFGYPTIGLSGTANKRGVMLADMLGECSEVATELARIADNARIAGVACEAQYNSLRK